MMSTWGKEMCNQTIDKKIHMDQQTYIMHIYVSRVEFSLQSSSLGPFALCF